MLRGKPLGLPIVTSAITHGLSLVGDLFVDEGDRIVLPSHLWGNYRLTYEVRLGAKVETFPTYDDAGLFNVEGLRATLAAGPEKQIVLLNFPNNPTGYMPGRREVEGIRAAIADAAEGGSRILAVIDDAYFGLNYDDHGLDESPFGYLLDAHPRVLAVKLDGATKELFVWGLRCGFLTFAAPPGVEEPEPLLAALERKTMGAIRGGISNCPHISQSLVLSALRSATIDAERKQKLETLKARALKIREVASREVYRRSWDVYPFNSGYFMCIRVKGVDAESLRVHLLDQHGVGLISIGTSDIRVAFSCLELDEIEPMFEIIDQGIRELRAA
jgi:aspartate/methionine/tyrosine aminotransferase